MALQILFKKIDLGVPFGTRGFVPTMGALHEGHLALVRKALLENDEVVVSIFVNPTQFNNPDDLKAYPRTLESDLELLEPLGDLIVYVPSVEEIYPTPSLVTLQFGYLEHILEGEFRPGHFQGVGQVVSKLFHHVKPSRAYFGLKDLQQVAVIQALVDGLDFPVEIIPCPTVREKNGLAMSSRNQRLSSQVKEEAGAIFQGLKELKIKLQQGENWEESKRIIWQQWANRSTWEPEYLEVVQFPALTPVDFPWRPGKRWSICTAVYVEGVRLIDNLMVE